MTRAERRAEEKARLARVAVRVLAHHAAKNEVAIRGMARNSPGDVCGGKSEGGGVGLRDSGVKA
jgi:hypothetical protein